MSHAEKHATSVAFEELVEQLRLRGYRITLPRRRILRVMVEHSAHMTVEQIRERLDADADPIDEATIYRTLQWLKQNRMVAQMTPGSGADVYALLGDDRHHHLICVECGAISDVDDALFASLRERIENDYGFMPFIDHYPIFGLCRRCRPGRPSERPLFSA